MTTVFTPIIEGVSDIQRIFWEDEHHIAFLTHRPHTRGHTLVIPKKEYATYLDMPEDEYLRYMAACKRIGAFLNEVFQPIHVGVSISGFEVPHVHVHVLPLQAATQMDSINSQPATKEELEELTVFLLSKSELI